jgi:hypothetical protein
MARALLTEAVLTMEFGFSLTLNFATLYFGKIESLHFQKMEDCI